MPKYKITSDEGVEFAKKHGVITEAGEVVDLNIKDEELAVIAAGWLEHVTPAKPAKEKE